MQLPRWRAWERIELARHHDRRARHHAPERRNDIVSLGLKSIVSGTLATCLMGAIVGSIVAQ
jgi:hypothetical protein